MFLKADFVAKKYPLLTGEEYIEFYNLIPWSFVFSLLTRCFVIFGSALTFCVNNCSPVADVRDEDYDFEIVLKAKERVEEQLPKEQEKAEIR